MRGNILGPKRYYVLVTLKNLYHEGVMVVVEEVTDQTIADFVLGHARPVFLLVCGQQCADCENVLPFFELMSEQSQGVLFAKIDADKNPKTHRRFGIVHCPTIVMLQYGNVKAKCGVDFGLEELWKLEQFALDAKTLAEL